MISVIVIGKNEGARLDACLQSVREALSLLSHELLYVDSRSTDDSLQIAASHGARCFLLEETHTTAGLGRFVGTQEAHGEYLLFLDGDMRLHKDFVEHAITAMVQRGYDGACGIRRDVYLRADGSESVCENYYGCTAERLAPEFGGAILLKAEALASCGGWSTDTVACEESELHARLLASHLRIVELPVPMITHIDAVRDRRGVLGTIFSARRLGEGQAFRCAMAHGSVRAYVRLEREKFIFYALDWACLIGILLLSMAGIIPACFVQAMQLGFLFARKRPRAFISAKLFFFGFPLGLLTAHRRNRAYRAV